ncbi:MAG: hypothetical protein V4671_07675 [Armatimonadota bacterium]
MQQFILFLGSTTPHCRGLRSVAITVLAFASFAPLLAACGCHDVKGAAAGTAGQLNERQKRDKEATDILDSGTKR